jgi:hypothetical protein
MWNIIFIMIKMNYITRIYSSFHTILGVEIISLWFFIIKNICLRQKMNL